MTAQALIWKKKESTLRNKPFTNKHIPNDFMDITLAIVRKTNEVSFRDLSTR